MRRRPRIGTVLLLMSLVVLVLPLSGVWALRLYESALIRQTESELIAQGALAAAMYRDAWRAAGGAAHELGPPPRHAWSAPSPAAGPWQPRLASLDLADDPILPQPPDGTPQPVPAGPAALSAGARITPILQETRRITLAAVRVLDHRGVVVASTGEELGLSLTAREEVGRALQGEPVSVLRRRVSDFEPPTLDSISRGAALRVFTVLPIVEADRMLGAVLLSRTPRTIGQTLHAKRWHLVGLAALLLGSVALLAALTATTIGRPLARVTRAAKAIADGGAAEMPRPSRVALHEVVELADALARMSHTLERRADYIRDFALQVSHEFKTPLTAIRGTIELLRDHLATMAPEERERFLGILQTDSERLDRLVRRLLELARAEVMRAPDAAHCDLVGALERMAETYRGLGLAIDVSVDAPLQVAMGEDTLETILRNLLDNVRQHAAAAHVTLRAARDGAAAVLTITDDGPGISAANAARVFDRFFTTARGSGGTGLGLSIVQSLVVAHRGVIKLLPSVTGTALQLRLPLA